MTTIAFRDGVLAADSLVTCNGLRDSTAVKIHRVKGVLLGGSGASAIYQKFRDWVVGGMKGQCPIEGHDFNGLLVSPFGVIGFNTSGPVFVNAPFYALGSGYQIAMGAMEMGATAEEAVAAAIKWDISSGGEVVTLSL